MVRCSEESLARCEPLAGTAPVARRWLMVEMPQGWEPQPLETPPLTDDVRDAMAHAEVAHEATVLLVRRPGRPAVRPVRRWWAVDTATRGQVRGEWAAPEDLVDAAVALGSDLDEATRPADLALLVCTHGTRDQCCAISGRPLARDLAERWPAATWECTHLGGHRFAPTFAVLPDGAVYGRVPDGQGVSVVEDHLAGRVRGELLRGVSLLDPPEQAAVAAEHRASGPTGIRNVRVDSTTVVAQDQWRVRLAGPRGAVEASVTATHHDPVLLSCPPGKLKQSVTYAVSALESQTG